MSLKVNYYWFHHMYVSLAEQDKIDKVIQTHNYDGFMQFYMWYQMNPLNNPNKLTFFPQTACVFDEDTGEPVEEINILLEENFNRIDYSECECG